MKTGPANEQASQKKQLSTPCSLPGTRECGHFRGPAIHDVEAQRARLAAQAPPSTLRWMDVGCVVLDRSGASGKRILQGCCGEALPGELVAIVGPSGANKSSSPQRQ
jgi:hypothetical protein